MPMVMEAIDNMSADERLQTMEYLWAAMTRVAAPEPPIWHGQVLAERRRRAEAGEETFISLDESKRRFRALWGHTLREVMKNDAGCIVLTR